MPNRDNIHIFLLVLSVLLSASAAALHFEGMGEPLFGAGIISVCLGGLTFATGRQARRILAWPRIQRVSTRLHALPPPRLAQRPVRVWDVNAELRLSLEDLVLKVPAFELPDRLRTLQPIDWYQYDIWIVSADRHGQEASILRDALRARLPGLRVGWKPSPTFQTEDDARRLGYAASKKCLAVLSRELIPDNNDIIGGARDQYSWARNRLRERPTGPHGPYLIDLPMDEDAQEYLRGVEAPIKPAQGPGVPWIVTARDALDRIQEDFAGMYGANGTQRDPIFISYAHEDQDLRDAIVAEHPDTEGIWHDGQLGYGDDFHRKIQSQVLICKSALLLVSRAFLESIYVTEHELGPLRELVKSYRIENLLWILVDDCNPEGLFFTRFNCFNHERPIRGMSPTERAQVVREVAQVLRRAAAQHA